MDFPKLNVESRDREFRLYTPTQRESVVIRYIFDGLSHRELDAAVLGLNPGTTRGYQSMGILHRYGLDRRFKGIFAGMSPDEALDTIPPDHAYDFLRLIVSGMPEQSGSGESWIGEDTIGYDVTTLTKARVNQERFRASVLDAYHHRCCVTGISEDRLLIASHIRPWRDSSETEKTAVSNGLCLNSLHDKAFDCGLITVDSETLCVRLSKDIDKVMPLRVYEDFFGRFDGIEIENPREGCGPDREHLRYHNIHIFGKAGLI